jgi:hypothetical protein
VNLQMYKQKDVRRISYEDVLYTDMRVFICHLMNCNIQYGKITGTDNSAQKQIISTIFYYFLFEQPIAEITCQRENTVTSRFYYKTKQ